MTLQRFATAEQVAELDSRTPSTVPDQCRGPTPVRRHPMTELNRGPTPSTMVFVEGARGTYPVDDGDVTVVGRHQQVVVAVWILGFMAGPLPAIIALLVRPGRGVYHRLVVAAAWFWSVAVVVGGISVWLAVERESVWFMAGWVAMLVAGFVASGLAVRTAMRRI